VKKDKAVAEKRRFLIIECALIAASAFFAFALVGYTVLALVLLFAAAVTALYRLLFAYSRKNARRARALRRALTGLLAAGLLWFAAVEVPIVAAARTDRRPEAPYLIVLGAGVNGVRPSLSLLNRLEAAKRYLEAWPETVAVLSGGQGPGEDITEAECMRRWLLDAGISGERLVKEAHSASTYENLENALALIAETGGDPGGRVAVLSSEYHLYRAKYLAKRLGADPVGVAARTSYPVLMVNYFIREAFAVTLLWIM
jgi:uncharacterized SAM-binding protein YcdF (DUF218 family)